MRGTRLVLALLALFAFGPDPATAAGEIATQSGAEEKIVVGLSQNRVSITADFDGDEIMIYGAIKREAPAPEGLLNVIVTVEGPSTPVIVRRKARVAGIWINNDSVNILRAPSFYAVASNGTLDKILLPEENHRHAITIDQLVLLEAAASASAAELGAGDRPSPAPGFAMLLKESNFIKAMVRVRSNEGRYRVLENSVQLNEQTLFRTDISLPSNLTEGTYRVRLFLLREGRVIDSQERFLRVRKEGLERMIYNLAQEQPFLHGLLALVIAAFAGWAASAIFKLIRP